MLSIRFIKITALSFGLFLSGNSLSQIVINEYSCSNSNGITDAFGEREDWVELHNPTAAAVDISGFYLSDKSGNLLKWAVPAGVSVPANGYTMVFGSKRDQVSGGQLHPNFSLTQTKGEWIILSNTLGNVVDSLKIVHMTKSDHSVGRSTDGAADWIGTHGVPVNGENATVSGRASGRADEQLQTVHLGDGRSLPFVLRDADIPRGTHTL